ncbi:MAG: glycogen-debranching protein [Fusobacteriaceae bacterium]|jgi:glycogen operon protein|nr:glycogen-debranching protein [Fusobacteriaceae bacterium]
MDAMAKGTATLGANVTDDGINFAIYAKNKTSVVLNIYYNNIDYAPGARFVLDPAVNKTDDIWHIFIRGLKEDAMYTWVLDESPELLDPFALSYSGCDLYGKRKSIAVKMNKNDTAHIRRPLEDLILYEAHIGHFTKNPNSRVIFPGTYFGFSEKIPYLKELGINAVELMPVVEWDDRTINRDLTGELLKNVWGYNPLGFFAVSKKYSGSHMPTTHEEVEELKNLVRELHNNGIEVILDIVYNHTAEGNKNGPVYNFKAMDREEFYMLEENGADYKNYSGCGNTFNCNGKTAGPMILASLRYWYEIVGVDGFRFDLASILGKDVNGQWLDPSLLDAIARDEVLKNARLISESWDMGGYHLGDMPRGWSEWNGKYRDVVRRFVRGDFELIPELLKRIFGSPDLFKKDDRKPGASINFVTCHDGFTMLDLVSYSTKHNLNNGENNNDGENQNFSANWGEEGLTSNPRLRALRKKLIKNMFLILLISQGTPMIRMGDELGHTQYGNNNPYCQDNFSTWINWDRAYANFWDIHEFVKHMIALRKKYRIFRKSDYLEIENPAGDAAYDVALHGVSLNAPDFGRTSLSIAFTLYDRDTDTRFHIALNSYHSPLTFMLPPVSGERKWRVLVDTAIERQEDFSEAGEVILDNYTLASNSCLILMDKRPEADAKA